jgi:hypothetical protein
MTKLPILPARPDEIDGLEIATPCEIPWDSLAGDARVRHCGKCKQNVYNIEAMSRGEALRLVAAREGRVCLRIFRRPDGTVVTADCWSRLRAARARGLGAFVAVLVVAGLAELAAMAFGLLGLRRLTDGGRTMGAVAPVPTVSVPRPGAPPPAIVPPGDWLMGKPTQQAPRAPGHHTLGRMRRSP